MNFLADHPKLEEHRVGGNLESRVKVLRRMLWSPENGLRNPRTLFIARQITQHCNGRDASCELRKIYQFVIENVRYTGDIAGADTFSAPIRTMQMGGEDCDGHAVLVAALAIANGFYCKFRITSNTGASWDHIYCMVGLPKGHKAGWVALDTTLARNRHDFSRFGHEPRRAKYQDFTAMERM